jgi:hypothetical protein
MALRLLDVCAAAAWERALGGNHYDSIGAVQTAAAATAHNREHIASCGYRNMGPFPTKRTSAIDRAATCATTGNFDMHVPPESE